MKIINKKILISITTKHEFDNNIVYLEVTKNKKLKDCYFVEKQFLNKDGSIKNGGIKYFYSENKNYPEKIIKKIEVKEFNEFQNLFYYDLNGEIRNINE